MKKSICFAYFADGKFIGWYGGTFGGVSKCPKIYPNTEHQKKVVAENLSYKIKKINSSSFDEAKEKPENTGLAALGLLTFASEEKLRGKEIELRVVESPEYDGIDVNFDKEAYEKLKNEHHQKMKDAGIFDIPAPSYERSKAIDDFEKVNPRPKCNNWIYADYDKVEEWAKNEPTEFIDVIKPE